MKIIFNYFLLALCICTMTDSFAQRHCGFDAVHSKLLQTDPDYLQKVIETNNQIRSYQQSNLSGLRTTSTAPVTIPVVVHIIHSGGVVGSTYNPADADINEMLDYLNATYSATYTGSMAAHSQGPDIGLRFALAKTDPNCSATTGIVRVDGSSLAGYSTNGVNLSGSSGASEVTVKALSKWPNDLYYNIWIVNKIDGQDGSCCGVFTAGYAYFPGTSAAKDGTIMLATQIGEL
jgi:hypothetical protein